MNITHIFVSCNTINKVLYNMSSDSILDSEILNREKEPVARIKKLRKTPVTFHIKLTEEQKQTKAIALANTVTVLTGKPGTSKTTVICHVALDLLISGVVSKIIVTRPTVEVSKTMGFLPGDAFDFKEGKMAPYLAPILQAMTKLRSKDEIDKLIKEGKIEIVPIQFIRGLNFEDCVVIVDETQNATVEELKAITTRICKDAKMLFTSDLNQVDLKNGTSAGLFFDKISHLKGVAMVELLENFRHPLALEIMDVIDEELSKK